MEAVALQCAAHGLAIDGCGQRTLSPTDWKGREITLSTWPATMDLQIAASNGVKHPPWHGEQSVIIGLAPVALPQARPLKGDLFIHLGFQVSSSAAAIQASNIS